MEGCIPYSWAVAMAAILKMSTFKGELAKWSRHRPELSGKVCIMKTQELDTVFGGPWDFEMILFIAAFHICWPGNTSMKER